MTKAIYIYPEDLGLSEYSEKWLAFIKKCGYISGTTWPYVVVIPIDID